MKKIFEKHTIAKMIGILVFITIVLTWIFKASIFQLGQHYEVGKFYVGISDLPHFLGQAIYLVTDKIVFFLALGCFYGVLSRTKGYNKIVGQLVKKTKGKELIVTVAVSLLLIGLTSVTNNTFALFMFIPFIITVLLNAGLNKITAFAATIGAILVGILGATVGSDQLLVLNTLFSGAMNQESVLNLSMKYRIIILCVSVALYTFFLVFAVKKQLENKKKKAEEVCEEFKIEDVSKAKKVKTLPIIIVLSVLTIVFILGFVDWNRLFGIKAFDDLHNWLTGIKIGKNFKIVSNILGGTALPFGSFHITTISIIMILFSIFIGILYSISFDELLSAFASGMKKFIKPIGAIVGVYIVFAITANAPIVQTMTEKIMHKDGVPELNIDYNGAGYAFFNVDVDDDGKADLNLINQDLDKDGKCDINCDTNKDGYPDKNLDFNVDGKVTDYDLSIVEQLKGGKSVTDLDADGDGKADVNIDTDFSLPKTIVASFVKGIFYNDEASYNVVQGDYYTSYFTTHFSNAGIGLIFLVLFSTYALLQFFIPTSVILMFGLTYVGVSYKDWMKYIWRFILGMLCVQLIIFIFMAM